MLGSALADRRVRYVESQRSSEGLRGMVPLDAYRAACKNGLLREMKAIVTIECAQRQAIPLEGGDGGEGSSGKFFGRGKRMQIMTARSRHNGSA